MKKTDYSKRCSLQILTRNRNNYLAVLLHSLSIQSFTNWDIIICDNNDKGKEVVRDALVMRILNKIQSQKHEVILLQPKSDEHKQNIGESRNTILNIDKNPYGCRIDDDSICAPDYLNLLHKVLTSKKGCVAVGGVVPTYGPEYYKYHPKIFNEIVKTSVPKKWLDMSKQYDDIEGFDKDEVYFDIKNIPDAVYHYNPMEVAVIPSHHLQSSYMYLNEALKAIDGFPSSDDTGFREETIACLKLLDKGHKIYTHTQAICYHLWCPNNSRLRTGTPEEVMQQEKKHQKKILMNELHFQREYRELMEKLFGGKKK